MKKVLFVLSLFFVVQQVSAQIQVLKITGAEAKDYSLGFGGVLKLSIPANEASDAIIEIGANFFRQKDDPDYGMAIIPLKLGYRYTVNGTGAGFYLQPEAGYNIYGVKSVYNDYNYEDKKFHGIIGNLGFGYLFEPGSRIQMDLGAFYERVFYGGGNTSYVGLRLTHNFSLSKRETY